MDIFGPKPSVKPLAKMSIFRLFELFSYILKRHFFVLECHRRHFRDLYCLKKKKLEKWPFLDQNHGSTPLEKRQFFDFLNFLFFIALKDFFFVLEYHKRRFPGLY